MLLDPGFLALAIPAVIFAGISKGGFGSGAAFLSSAIMALVIDPGLALGVMLPLLMLIDLASLRPYWGKWLWRESAVLIIASVPGVALGVLFYTQADDDALRVLIGLVALLFVIWQFAQRQGWVRGFSGGLPQWVGAILGVLAGFTSFISHAGGPPAAMYLLSRKITKTEYQASSVLVFWVINIAKAVPYAFLGMFTLETAQANLLLAPFALLGTWLGVKAHYIVPDKLFFGLTYVLLGVTGARLVWLGLT